MKQQIEDKIVLRVLARFNERSRLGIMKYNTTLERNDLSAYVGHAVRITTGTLVGPCSLTNQAATQQLFGLGVLRNSGNFTEGRQVEVWQTTAANFQLPHLSHLDISESGMCKASTTFLMPTQPQSIH